MRLEQSVLSQKQQQLISQAKNVADNIQMSFQENFITQKFSDAKRRK